MYLQVESSQTRLGADIVWPDSLLTPVAGFLGRNCIMQLAGRAPLTIWRKCSLVASIPCREGECNQKEGMLPVEPAPGKPSEGVSS